jgi:hypothetical protein
MIPPMGHSTCSRVLSVDYRFFVNSSVITFIMAHTSLLRTHSSSSSSSPAGGGGGGGGLSLFWWHGEQKAESNTFGYGLVKTKCKTEGGSTHYLKHLTPLLQVFYLHYKWQSVAI